MSTADHLIMVRLLERQGCATKMMVQVQLSHRSDAKSDIKKKPQTERVNRLASKMN